MNSIWTREPNSSDTNRNANEQFRIVSMEKLLEVRKLLDEILEIKAGDKLQENNDPISTPQKTESKSFNK